MASKLTRIFQSENATSEDIILSYVHLLNYTANSFKNADTTGLRNAFLSGIKCLINRKDVILNEKTLDSTKELAIHGLLRNMFHLKHIELYSEELKELAKIASLFGFLFLVNVTHFKGKQAASVVFRRDFLFWFELLSPFLYSDREELSCGTLLVFVSLCDARLKLKANTDGCFTDMRYKLEESCMKNIARIINERSAWSKMRTIMSLYKNPKNINPCYLDETLCILEQFLSTDIQEYQVYGYLCMKRLIHFIFHINPSEAGYMCATVMESFCNEEFRKDSYMKAAFEMWWFMFGSLHDDMHSEIVCAVIKFLEFSFGSLEVNSPLTERTHVMKVPLFYHYAANTLFQFLKHPNIVDISDDDDTDDHNDSDFLIIPNIYFITDKLTLYKHFHVLINAVGKCSIYLSQLRATKKVYEIWDCVFKWLEGFYNSYFKFQDKCQSLIYDLLETVKYMAQETLRYPRVINIICEPVLKLILSRLPRRLLLLPFKVESPVARKEEKFFVPAIFILNLILSPRFISAIKEKCDEYSSVIDRLLEISREELVILKAIIKVIVQKLISLDLNSTYLSLMSFVWQKIVPHLSECFRRADSSVTDDVPTMCNILLFRMRCRFTDVTIEEWSELLKLFITKLKGEGYDIHKFYKDFIDQWKKDLVFEQYLEPQFAEILSQFVTTNIEDLKNGSAQIAPIQNAQTLRFTEEVKNIWELLTSLMILVCSDTRIPDIRYSLHILKCILYLYSQVDMDSHSVIFGSYVVLFLKYLPLDFKTCKYPSEAFDLCLSHEQYILNVSAWLQSLGKRNIFAMSESVTCFIDIMCVNKERSCLDLQCCFTGMVDLLCEVFDYIKALSGSAAFQETKDDAVWLDTLENNVDNLLNSVSKVANEMLENIKPSLDKLLHLVVYLGCVCMDAAMHDIEQIEEDSSYDEEESVSYVADDRTVNGMPENCNQNNNLKQRKKASITLSTPSTLGSHTTEDANDICNASKHTDAATGLSVERFGNGSFQYTIPNNHHGIQNMDIRKLGIYKYIIENSFILQHLVSSSDDVVRNALKDMVQNLKIILRKLGSIPHTDAGTEPSLKDLCREDVIEIELSDNEDDERLTNSDNISEAYSDDCIIVNGDIEHGHNYLQHLDNQSTIVGNISKTSEIVNTQQSVNVTGGTTNTSAIAQHVVSSVDLDEVEEIAPVNHTLRNKENDHSSSSVTTNTDQIEVIPYCMVYDLNPECLDHLNVWKDLENNAFPSSDFSNKSSNSLLNCKNCSLMLEPEIYKNTETISLSTELDSSCTSNHDHRILTLV